MSRKLRYRYSPHTHYQCECMNAGVKGRICDLCGTPFSWLPSDAEWREMGPLPGDDGTEPWSVQPTDTQPRVNAKDLPC